jgi:hypothetical protein
MSLDDNIIKEEAKIPRRSFLKKAVTTLGSIMLAGYIGTGIGCKSTPTGPSIPVTLQFEVHNHTKGYKTQFTKNATSGDNISITTDYLLNTLGIRDVDPQRIGIREDGFNTLVTFSSSGVTGLTPKIDITRIGQVKSC